MKLNLNQDITQLSVTERATLYRRVKALRLETEHKLKPVQLFETQLKESLIADIDKTGPGVVFVDDDGTSRVMTVTRTRKPTIGDWDKVLAYIGETGRFDFLRKQLSDKAVTDTENWDQIPGIEAFNALSLSDTKI